MPKDAKGPKKFTYVFNNNERTSDSGPTSARTTRSATGTAKKAKKVKVEKCPPDSPLKIVAQSVHAESHDSPPVEKVTFVYVESPFPCEPHERYKEAWRRYHDVPEGQRMCLMKQPGVCQCIHCLPYVKAQLQPRQEASLNLSVEGSLRLVFLHECQWCKEQFRCLPSVPPRWGMPPNRLQACRCLVQYSSASGEKSMNAAAEYFCSNTCYWKSNGYISQYGSVQY